MANLQEFLHKVKERTDNAEDPIFIQIQKAMDELVLTGTEQDFGASRLVDINSAYWTLSKIRDCFKAIEIAEVSTKKE